MAFIERRDSGRYRARYRGPDGRERSKSFDRKTDAESWLAAQRTSVDTGSWVDPARGKVTLASWTQEWRASKVDLRPSSQARLDAALKHQVLPTFGARQLRTITNGDVRSWVVAMQEAGLSAASVRKAHNALRQMLASAVADRRIGANPAENVPLPAEHAHEQRFLSPTEVARLADCIDPRFQVLVLVAAYGGLRFGELAGLRRSRVDLLRGRLTVAEVCTDVKNRVDFGPPKTKNSRRVVPLPRRVLKALDAHMGTYTGPDADALVFTAHQGGPLRRARFRTRYWLPAVSAAGLDGLRFHDLRHTFVAMWIDAGANPKKVSVRAGHSSAAFTLDRYGHLYEDSDDETDRLDDMLDPLDEEPPEGELRRLA